MARRTCRNLGHEPEAVELGDMAGVIEVSTHPENNGGRVDGRLDLAGNEACVVRLD